MTTARSSRRVLAGALLFLLALLAFDAWQTAPLAAGKRGEREHGAARGKRGATRGREAPDERAARVPNAAARAIVDAAIARFTREMELDSTHARYLECEHATPGSAECRELRDAALYGAAARVLEPFAVEEAKQMMAACGGKPMCARQELVDVLLGEGGTLATISAAHLMLVLDQETPTVFPIELYSGFESRTDPELQLILNAHLATPLPSAEAADAVMQLALDPNTTGRVKLAAVHALGHESHLEQLRPIVAAMRAGAPHMQVLRYETLPHALARCGETCQPELDSLAMDARADLRAIAYRALTRMNEGESEKMKQRWLAAPGKGVAVEAEMIAAESMFETTGG